MRLSRSKTASPRNARSELEDLLGTLCAPRRRPGPGTISSHQHLHRQCEARFVSCGCHRLLVCDLAGVMPFVCQCAVVHAQRPLFALVGIDSQVCVHCIVPGSVAAMRSCIHCLFLCAGFGAASQSDVCLLASDCGKCTAAPSLAPGVVRGSSHRWLGAAIAGHLPDGASACGGEGSCGWLASSADR